ncbi:MAG: ubiquinone/menaquinone biosynthesis methyltransferase, partial [Chloroherpetonaceae bacterium]|nr:ubiquinone/menaquinone biosynthesis methyltransferase [Chloroherpetonaceae bacterium]
EIAPVYDLLNRTLSLGLDQYWRRTAVKLAYQMLSPRQAFSALDVATGTGDFAQLLQDLPACTAVVGIDLSAEMLRYAQRKVPTARFEAAAVEALPFESETFELVTIGFGARNFADLSRGLSEIYRVLKPNGVAVFLEPMLPRRALLRRIYSAYFKHLLPRLASLLSPSDYAYYYLPCSVEAFASGEDFLLQLGKVRFRKALWRTLSFETAAIYLAQK